MSVFDDMVTAMKDYPAANVKIEIVDFTLVDGSGVLNINEDATFNVLITNSGPLGLTGVTVLVKPTPKHGARLISGFDLNPGGEPRPIFTDEIETDPLPTIGGHGGSVRAGPFTMRAPSKATDPKSVALVTASLQQWNGDLAHILVDHSNPDASVNDSVKEVVVAL
jgi:hypothetical protein